jgi:hypothetical protein
MRDRRHGDAIEPDHLEHAIVGTLLEAAGDPKARVVHHESDVEIGGRVGEAARRILGGEVERDDPGRDRVVRLEVTRQGAQALRAARGQHQVDAL